MDTWLGSTVSGPTLLEHRLVATLGLDEFGVDVEQFNYKD